jgi:hypothetical protein
MGLGVISWEKAQEIANLMDVVKDECRRDALSVSLQFEGFKLIKVIPSSQLFDPSRLAAFVRLNTRKI